MKTPICYYGGKQGMIKDIMPLVPDHTVYNEPFAGGAALLFAKEPVKVNVINDLNGELVNFYRTIVSDFDALKTEIESTLHAREQHQVAWFIYNNPDYFNRVKRAWAVWVLSNLGFSGLFSSSFSFARGTGKKTTKIINAKERFNEDLQQLLECCTIEQDDAFAVIQRYDTPETFHFIDPPYVGFNMGHYNSMFSKEDMQRLLELLIRIKGKFMLTMYPDEMISQYVDANSWRIHKVERCVTAANVKRRKQEEWMILNYETIDKYSLND